MNNKIKEYNNELPPNYNNWYSFYHHVKMAGQLENWNQNRLMSVEWRSPYNSTLEEDVEKSVYYIYPNFANNKILEEIEFLLKIDRNTLLEINATLRFNPIKPNKKTIEFLDDLINFIEGIK